MNLLVEYGSAILRLDRADTVPSTDQGGCAVRLETIDGGVDVK